MFLVEKIIQFAGGKNDTTQLMVPKTSLQPTVFLMPAWIQLVLWVAHHSQLETWSESRSLSSLVEKFSYPSKVVPPQQEFLFFLGPRFLGRSSGASAACSLSNQVSHPQRWRKDTWQIIWKILIVSFGPRFNLLLVSTNNLFLSSEILGLYLPVPL